MSLVRAVLERDGVVLRDLVEDDAELLASYLETDWGAVIFPGTVARPAVADFLRGQRTTVWSRPMVCLRDDRPTGVLLNHLSAVHSLNTMSVALLEAPRRDRVAIALQVRHLFWACPLHRVWAELPAGSTELGEAFSWAGFTHEGTMPGHRQSAGSFHDVAVHGLLRRDFDAWVARELPDLALAPAP